MTLQVSYTGRNIQIPSAFKEHVQEKIDKIEQLADKGHRLEVKVASENSHRRADTALTVELTVIGRGKVVRSEAQAEDKFAAFEIALNKLTERLRRVRDRKKSRAHNASRNGAPDVATAMAGLDPVSTDRPLYEQVLDATAADDHPPAEDDGDSATVKIRRKVFPADPMSVDAAVDAMELVGHDFYVYIDAETGQPSAVYRRRGWTYGVISLDVDRQTDEPTTEERTYRPENGTTPQKVGVA